MTGYTSVRAYRRARESFVSVLCDYARIGELYACNCANAYMGDQGAYIMGEDADA